MFIELSILFLSICLIITIFIALCYFGLFEPIEVKTGESPYILGGKKFIYKTYRAETTNIGSDFTKLTNLLSSFQDSSLVPTLITQPQGSEPTKSFLGVIFEKGNDDAEQLLISKDYKIMTLPQVDHTVSVIFPNRGSISVAIGLKRVYPAITNYIRENKLCAYPFIEVYKEDMIFFLSPLSKQQDFFINEILSKKECTVDTEDDATAAEYQTLITDEHHGKDSIKAPSIASSNASSLSSFERLVVEDTSS